MKLTFIGAAHEVTGSCHFLQAAGKNILIDCGMEQGPDLYENPGLPIPESEVDYVFLTHAHIDHRNAAEACEARICGTDIRHICHGGSVRDYAPGQCAHTGI